MALGADCSAETFLSTSPPSRPQVGWVRGSTVPRVDRRHHSVVPHSMKITVLYPLTLLEESTQKDSESLKLVHRVRPRVLSHHFMNYLSNGLYFIKAVKFASKSNKKMH